MRKKPGLAKPAFKKKINTTVSWVLGKNRINSEPV